MNRRRFIESALGFLGLSASGMFFAGCSPGAKETLETAAEFAPANGTPYPLVALPGKAPLGQVYDRPPNYETPTTHLIGQKKYPFTDNEYYYVRYREADVEHIPAADFRLKVGGENAQKTLVLTLDDLRKFPRVEIGAVGECTGEGRGLIKPLVPGLPWTKGDLSCAFWAGASLKAVLEEAGIKPGATQVAFRGGRIISLTKPQYWRAYPFETAMHPDALLAYEMNGEDLPLWNGYPLRLVVPGTYAPPWVKQLREIEIRSTPQPLEWSGRPITAGTLKTYSLIATPPDGSRVPVGKSIELTGIAWDSGKGIAKVEISLDDGATWEEARIEQSYGKYVWRVWHHSVQTAQKGEFRILSRATSADGETQPMDPSEEIIKGGARKNNAVRTFAAVLTGV
jgi:DMSO/TMAO reductase YedYZ molybdopterin-dependent catalytic subunit